jgi:hypothetical protein
MDVLFKEQGSLPSFAKATEGTVGSGGFEPPKSKDSGFTVRPIWPLWKLPFLSYIEPVEGFEPPTS